MRGKPGKDGGGASAGGLLGGAPVHHEGKEKQIKSNRANVEERS